jgi:hypothetical protein
MLTLASNKPIVDGLAPDRGRIRRPAKQFYARLGCRLDADRTAGDNFRLVQFTRPGSGSSIQFGVNLTSAAPDSAQAIDAPSIDYLYSSAGDAITGS